MTAPKRRKMPISVFLKRFTATIVAMLAFTAGCIFFSVAESNRAYLNSVRTAVANCCAQADKELATMNRYAINILYYNENMNSLKKADNVLNRNYYALSLLNDIETATAFLNTRYTFCIVIPGQELTLTSTGNLSYAEKQGIVSYILEHYAAEEKETVSGEEWATFSYHGSDYNVQIYSDGENKFIMFCASESLLSAIDTAFAEGSGSWMQLAGKTGAAAQFDVFRASLRETVRMKRLATPVYYECLREWSVKNLTITLAPLLIVAVLNITLLMYMERSLKRNIIEPLRNFAQDVGDESAVQNVWRGDAQDEITDIARVVSGLYDTVHAKTISAYEEGQRRQKAEMEFLQLQIKPHFYINCLGVIFSLAQCEKYTLIQKMAVNLSNYMRYLFTDAHHLVPIGREIEHISEYLDIQNIRLKTEHTLRCVDADMLQYQVPVLSLLTIAENSSKHNRQLDRPLEITLHVEDAGDGIRIYISDNGVGFPAEALDRLNGEDDPRDSGAVSGIGISNVKKRLKMIYGEKYSIQFYNGTNGGAVTVIEIPKTTDTETQ